MKNSTSLLLIILLMFIAGCGNSSSSSEYPPAEQGGILSLRISSPDFETRTLEPDIEMSISSYDIYGIGPGSSSFSMEDTTDEFISIGINPGSWAISVLAKNSSETVIASGDTTVIINEGEVTSATVTVTPLDGTGILMLSISWPANILEVPAIDSTLTLSGESPIDLPFTMAPDNISASYSNSSIDPGYYLLIIKLTNSGALVWEGVEAVRIIAGETTDESFALTAKDINLGGLDLSIVPDLQNPISINLNGDMESLTPGTDMTVTATTSEPVDSYQWYIKGDPIPGEISDTITIGSLLTNGVYRLYLVVRKDDIISSTGFQFSVTDEEPLNNTMFINELHYDNAGTDQNEGFEIAGTALTDLTGYSVILYNGGNGEQYSTIDLSGNTITDQENGYGTVFFGVSSMQNGPDGIALVDPDSTVIQFLSYGGVITAANGPASGMSSEDIGVSESSSTPVGHSLQLGGTGTSYSDFSWRSPDTSTNNTINNEQTFGP